MLLNDSPSNKPDTFSIDDLDEATRKALKESIAYFDKHPPRAWTKEEIENFFNSL